MLIVLGILYLFEIVFTNSANWAFPILRDIFPSGSGLYSIIRITLGGIVNITAYCAFVFVHFNSFVGF
jgi:hypothetical protein